MRVLGAGSAGIDTPATVRPSNPDPSPPLVVVNPFRQVVATPITRAAVMRPLRIDTSDTVATLCALDLVDPMAPVVSDVTSSDDSAPGTLRLWPDASAISPFPGLTEGSTANGVLPCEATGVWTYAP